MMMISSCKKDKTDELKLWYTAPATDWMKEALSIGKEVPRKIYFSTDLNLSASDIFRYYRSRFQIEFIYRDAKQYTGLCQCQGRSKEKPDFHWNAALTTINLAKIQHRKEQFFGRENFSMENSKTLCNNALLIDRFLDVFGINPNADFNQKKSMNF